MRTPTPQQVLRLLIWCAVVLIWTGVLLLAPLLVTDRVFQSDDFMEYWAAGRLNAAGQNPYSAPLMAAVQEPLGRSRVVMMYNPPNALAIAMPFGWLPYASSRLAWLLLAVVMTGLAVSWLWQLSNAPRRYYWVGWALAFFFGPVINALHTGQISPFLLFGLVGFLWYMKREKYWLAGVLAGLTALKPHWMYLFWLVLLYWCIDKRRHAPLFGAALSVGGAVAIASLFNPSVVVQFLRYQPPTDWATPTLGGLLRLLVGPEHTGLQFAPLLIGIPWATGYYFVHRSTWNWTRHLPLVVLMSASTAAFGWTMDQSVLLVALVPILYGLAGTRTVAARVMLLVAGLINIAVLIIGGHVTDAWFWWLAPTWLAWFWISNRLIPTPPSRLNPAEPAAASPGEVLL